MSKRCKHLNGELIEFMDATHSRFVQDGEVEPEGPNEIGNIRFYEYRCDDCERCFRASFARDIKAPKWLQRYMAVAYL